MNIQLIKKATYSALILGILSYVVVSSFYPTKFEVSHKEDIVLCAPVSDGLNDETEQVEAIQHQLLQVFPELLQTTVKVILGNSYASAVVVSEDGYILTAAHVMDALGGKNGEVRLHDGSTYMATCLGQDTKSDYGLMKIEPNKKLAYAQMGNAATLAKDEACIMFGHPDVAEKERTAIARIGFYEGKTQNDYLKTSCVMMPGDSGGPIFDLHGKLIGICSFISYGMDDNYYPSIDNVKKNWDKLINSEHIDSGSNDYNQTIEIAPEIDKRYVLKGGKETLTKVLSKHSVNANKSVVKVESLLDETTVSTHGTIVSGEGYIVAKSSQIGNDDIYCFHNGNKVKAKIIGRNKDSDIAVLKIKPNRKLKPIVFGTINEEAGLILGTVTQNTGVEWSGILGLASQPIPSIDYGFLGVWFNQQEDLLLERLMEGKPAEKAGLMTGDKIVALESVMCQNTEEFMQELKKTRPQQEVTISVLRNNEEKDIQVVLGNRPNHQHRHPANNTQTNQRKDGFPIAFTHDMPLKTSQCGTPVVNLNGEVVGINIARRNRTCSLAFPLMVIKEIVDKIIANP